ncbi:PAAR domain-containing protein [Pantoea alhagi]|uniref:RHS repeat-associated core domain-containing protein n=1 Tax=Pantoea alhagi TaxID=1891675 RepID=UPI00202B7D38|nr:RHS repeat-associated core domain-containing protein [Pantoea alhagi]URQ59654.1 PAAR domain-containing protein [Pantoea alhagi]
MFEAARVGDDIGHSHALAGMIAGTLVGGLIAAAGGVAAGALMVTGIGASCLGIGVLLVGASLAVGYLTSELATATRNSIADAGGASMEKEGVLSTGSHNVFINGRPAAIATDSMMECARDGGSQQMAEGSSRVYINGLPAARTGDQTTCGGKVMTGSKDVIMGGEPEQTLPIQSEVPEWLYKTSDLTLLFAGLFGGAGGAAGKVGALGRLFSKIPGINKLARVACRAGVLMTGAAAVGIIARPVDIVSGQKFLSGDDELDFVLPSRLPVVWQRYWRSGNPGDSVLGRGWALFWETRLERYQDGLVWRAPSGDFVSFPLVPQGQRTFCETEKRWLEHHQDDSWSVYDISGERWHYQPLHEHSPSLPLRLTESCGNDILFTWNDDNTLHALTDSAGQSVVCRYMTVSGHVRLTGAWLDNEVCLVSYGYDNQARLLTVTDRGDQVRRRFSWYDDGDGTDLLRSHEDSNGLLNEYLWQNADGLPRVISYRNSAGEQLDFDYDFENGTRRATREDGTQAYWLIDDDDNVARFTDYDGHQTGFVYRDGELCDVILPDGAIRRSQWDRYGRLTVETDPAGRTTKYYWFRNTDRIARTEYPDLTAKQATYDLNGRLLTETDALNHTTAYHYPDEEETLPERITNVSGGDVILKWNHQGMLTQRTDCSGNITRFTYDRFGQLIRSENAEGHITRRQWNNAGQLTAVIRADGSQETLSWNKHGQLAAWRDPLESEVRWQYNALGLPLSQTDRNGITRRRHYDPRGNLLRLENGNGGEYRFTYDPVGRPLSETRPDDTSRQMEWNERGLLSSLLENGRPDNDGGIPRRAQLFSYDSSSLLIARTTRDAQYRYQRNHSGQLTGLTRTPTAEGMVLGLEEDNIQFTFDATGKLLTEQGMNGELHYAYDPLDNLTALTLSGDQQISWLHYGSGHVSAVRFNQQTVSEFTRDRLHRELSRSQGAREQRRGYDSLGRRILQRSAADTVPALPEQMIIERAFRYTGRGELSDVSDTLRGNTIYGYDGEGRLFRHYEASSGHSTRTFRYDAADNLLPDDGLSALSLTDNRLTRWQNLFMQYDGWGNLVSRQSGLYEQHYEYDAENRLIKAEGNGPQGRFTAYYHYDALGRRTRKNVITQRGTYETRFMWQGYRLLQEQQHSGQCTTYIYDPNEAYSPLARIDHLRDDSRGDILWFSTDLNGAPLDITDEQGQLRWSGHYSSFGEVVRQAEGFHRLTQQTALAHQPLRYAGQYADSETGLHYNLFRYYDPQVGRFTVQDPIGLAGGINLYSYAPNPLSYIDPLGLSDDKVNVYKDAPYHGTSDNSVKSRAPKNGQAALDNSVQVKPTSPRRVGVDIANNEIVVLDKTRSLSDQVDEYHGHVRDWDALDNKQQSALNKSGKTTRKGKICGV